MTRTPYRCPVSRGVNTRWSSRPGTRNPGTMRDRRNRSAGAGQSKGHDRELSNSAIQRGATVVTLLWEHTCCETRHWSAARLCDRCGAQAVVSVAGVSMQDAMERLHSLDERQPFVTRSAERPQGTAADPPQSVVVSPVEQVLPLAQPISERRPPVPNRRPIYQDDEDELPAARPPTILHPDLERALVFGLWLLTGVVCTVMAIGAVVEFERANFFQSFKWAILAAAAPTGIIGLAIDGWLKQRRWKTERI